MRTLPYASPLVGLPGIIIPAISPVFPTFSRKSAHLTAEDPSRATTTEMQELGHNSMKPSTSAATIQLQPAANNKRPWYLNNKLLNSLTVVSVGDTVAAIAVFCVQSRHNVNTAGYVVWFTVAVGITAVLLSFVVCLKITRCQIATSEIQDVDLERTNVTRQEEAVSSDHREGPEAVLDEEVSLKSSHDSLRQDQDHVEGKPVANDHDHFYFEHPDFEFAEWHRSNQGSPASQTSRFVRSGVSRSFSPYKVQQSGIATGQPNESARQREESKLHSDDTVIIRPPELAHLDHERENPSPLFKYPTNNGRGPVTAADTLRASEEILNKLRTRQSARTLASPRQHVSKTATASDLCSMVRHMARAPELSAYSNRPSGSKPDIRQGVDHKGHVATIDCASPVAKPTIRQVGPSSPASTSSESSMDLPTRDEEVADIKDDDLDSADKNNTKATDKETKKQTAHSIARTASWETVQTTATSLYRAPSSPANPHFNNSIPSLPTLARDYTLSSRPERINTSLRPAVPGSFPLTSPSPARPRSLLKQTRRASTLLSEATNTSLAKGADENRGPRNTPATALRKSSIKRLQSATSARLRKTVKKIDIYHDPATGGPISASSTVPPGLRDPNNDNKKSPRSIGSAHSRANSASPRSSAPPPRSPDEKENLADYAGAFAGGGDMRLPPGLERDDDERRGGLRGRYTPEIWEDEGMLVGAGFEGVEVYEGT